MAKLPFGSVRVDQALADLQSIQDFDRPEIFIIIPEAQREAVRAIILNERIGAAIESVSGRQPAFTSTEKQVSPRFLELFRGARRALEQEQARTEQLFERRRKDLVKRYGRGIEDDLLAIIPLVRQVTLLQRAAEELR